PTLAHLALADVGVLVAIGAHRDGAVVDVQAAQPVEADQPVEAVDDPRQSLGLADVEAAREQVAAVDADAEPLAAAGRLDEHRQLLEVASERARRAGGVLEQHRTALRLGQRCADELAGPRDGLGERRTFSRSGVEDDAVGAEWIAYPAGGDERGERLS